MTVTKTSNDVYFASGEIKFSVLRDTFKDSGTEIKASELFRDTDTNQPNPSVPDATENANIAGNDYSVQSHGSNLSLLGFRNSIKEYNFTQQVGTIDTKLDIDALDWNSNLPKNIKKKFIVNGTIGSDDPSVPAASVEGEIRNLTIDVGTAGKIHGAAGVGGVYGTNSGKGGDGGTALKASCTATDSDTSAIKIDLESSSEIFGGGGGGGAGPTGGTGGTGASVHNLAGGTGGAGGNGGTGGNGQGYNSGVGNGQVGSAGLNGATGNSKEYQVTDYDINAETPLQTMSDVDYSSGAGGRGGNGGYGGNGGAFGSNGDAGTSNGQGVGRTKGGDTTNAKYYQVPVNENFNTYGMLVSYGRLNHKNFIYKHNDICTAFGEAYNFTYDSNGAVNGYGKLVFWDGSGDDDNCIMTIETPTLAEGETAASNPRFNINGYGLFADSPGKIQINVTWNDQSGDAGVSVHDIIFNGSSGNAATFSYSSSGTLKFDYDPYTQSDWGSNPNIVVFGIYREATHDGNYITFGGKYTEDDTNFTPPQIDSTGAFPTFGPGTDSSQLHSDPYHHVDIVHVNYPATTLHAPIWARANHDGWHKGIEIKSNITNFNGIVGVALNDSGDDNDFDDLVVFPTDQRTYEPSTGRGLKLNSGVVQANNVFPALPSDQGSGGGAGRAVIGLNYSIIEGSPNNIKGGII